MKTALLFICLSIWGASAESYSQTSGITIGVKNGTVRDVINAIENQSDYTFVYNAGEVNLEKTISIHVDNKRIPEIIESVFNTDVYGYKIVEKHIVLYKKTVNQQVKNHISGVVTDERGEPIIGANLVVGGTTNGTISDFDGNFSLEVAPGSTLTVSYIGFITQQVKVIADKAKYTIALREDAETLDEVVVVGYGSIKKSDVTGSVASVNTEELMKRNPINLEQGLQGMAAGVQVVRTSGDPEGGVTVRIRGTATINNSADPLYVVDGIMVGTSASFLNPNDVESIEILKDASATAIYGSRGANGVIMITTKKGAKGRVSLTFNANFGVQTLSRKMDVTNAEQFAVAANSTAANDGTPPNPVWANPSALNNIDWQDEMSRNSLMQNYNLSVSGGSDNTQSMMSVSYLNNDGIIRASNYKRLTARANVNHKIKDFIRTGLNVSYMHSEKKGGGNMLNYATAIQTMDTLAVDGSKTLLHVPVQYADGTWGHFPLEGNGYNSKGADNPVAAAETRDELNSWNRVVASAFVEIDLFKGLTFKSVGGLNYDSYAYHNYARAHSRTFLGNATDDFTSAQNQNIELLLENYFTYDRTFNKKHHLTLLAGHSVSSYKPQDLKATSSIFPAETIRRIELTSDPSTLSAEGGLGRESRQQSFFGRVMYSFDERYLLTATIRRDGSSNFGVGNRYGNFPSASLAWRLSEERFIKNLDLFSNLKLRIGWGQTGNAGNSTNLSVDQLSSYRIAYYLYGKNADAFAIAPGLAQVREIDTNLKWETNEQTNVGLDVGVLNNALTLTLDYYRRDAKDLLLYRTLRPSTGYTNIYTNSGHIRNSGFEIQLGYQKSWGDWYLNVKANGTTLKNEAVEVGEDIYSSADVADGANWNNYSITRNGYPVGSFYGWRVDGIFQNQTEIDLLNDKAAAMGVEGGKYQNAVPGDFRYKDLNDDGTIDDEDREILGNGYPSFTYGLNVSLGWKNWDFNMYLYGVSGQDILSYSYRNLSNIGGADSGYHGILNDYASGAWHGEGSTNVHPRLTRQDPNHNSQVSDAYIMKGDFLKMQNVQIGYTFSKELLKPLRMESLRFFASVENLFTITGYKAGDPEVGTAKVLQTGFDAGRYPFPRTYTFGLSVGF